MMNITINENLEVATYEFDGETWEVEIDDNKLAELYLDAVNNVHNLFFEDEVQITYLSIEEYDGEFDIVLNTYTGDSMDDMTYSDKFVKTYKREVSAYNYAQKSGYKYVTI
jgi:hypothetical protein